MLRNGLVAIATAVIVGLGVVFQITATESHEVKDERPPAQVTEETGEQTDAPSAPADEERAPGDTNDETGGKPGEAPKG